ncbi:MAG: hypothetical protein ACRC2T_10815 [Thermoguttaceae bacterium]
MIKNFDRILDVVSTELWAIRKNAIQIPKKINIDAWLLFNSEKYKIDSNVSVNNETSKCFVNEKMKHLLDYKSYYQKCLTGDTTIDNIKYLLLPFNVSTSTYLGTGKNFSVLAGKKLNQKMLRFKGYKYYEYPIELKGAIIDENGGVINTYKNYFYIDNLFLKPMLKLKLQKYDHIINLQTSDIMKKITAQLKSLIAVQTKQQEFWRVCYFPNDSLELEFCCNSNDIKELFAKRTCDKAVTKKPPLLNSVSSYSKINSSGTFYEVKRHLRGEYFCKINGCNAKIIPSDRAFYEQLVNHRQSEKTTEIIALFDTL